MSTFMCCLWWFILGALLGWLLWWLFDKWFRRDGEAAGVRAANELAASRRRIASLETDLKSARLELGAKAEDASRMKVELDGARVSLGDFETRASDLGRRATSAEARLAEIQAQATAAESRAADALAAAAAAESRATAAVTKSADAEARVAAAAAKNADADRRTATAEAQLADANGRVAAAESRANAAEARANAAESRAAAADARAAAAEDSARSAGATAAVAGVMASAASFGFAPLRQGQDDLTIIEGIGPKISELLKARGIDTFARLAASSVDTVNQILHDAGPNFRLAKPDTWMRQADLCARNEWAALRQYQDELTAGVAPRKDNS